MSGRALAAASLLFSVIVSLARAADARPQITSGVTTGVALTDLRAENAPRHALHLGGRLDVLFGRGAPRDMAIGPYMEVLTEAFDTLEAGGGLAWLVPTTGATAFVFSGGAFARSSRFGAEPGAATTIFWGSRSFNYHSTYAIGVGLFASGRYGLGGQGHQADAVLGAQIDLEYLALPFVLAYQALAH